VGEFTEGKRSHVVEIVKGLRQTYNVYLLVCRQKVVRNQLIEAIRAGGASELGFQST
jgi:ethanolamine ammonia-lyase large subunit